MQGFSRSTEGVKGTELLSKPDAPKGAFDALQASFALLLALLIKVIYTR